jgi:cell division protein FtsN
MNEPDTVPQPEALDEDALRRRLINRIALAGVAIVVLLGGLAVIDAMYVAPPMTLPKTATLGAVTDITKSVNSQPVDNMGLSSVAAVPEMAEPVPEPPSPEAVPSIKRIAEPEESASPSTPLPKQAPPIPVKSVAPKQTAAAPASAPIQRPVTQQGTASASRFVLQMGVFNSIDNAQELLAKLQKNGVPAQIEARVQVGPFKTKAEADATRSKLKALGLDAGLLMATHK